VTTVSEEAASMLETQYSTRDHAAAVRLAVQRSRGSLSKWRIDRPFTMKMTISAMFVA
jgi:hypothetical protein